MRPENVAERAAEAGPAGRLHDVRPADLLIALGTHVGYNQIALLGEQEIAAGLFDDKGIVPAILVLLLAAGRFQVHPQPLARLRLQAAQLAVTAHAVDVIALEDGSTHDGVQPHRGVGPLAASLLRPQHRRGRLVRVEFEHDGAAVEGGQKEQIALLARRRDGHVGLDGRAELLRPVDAALLRIEAATASGCQTISWRLPPSVMMIGGQ